ncbi:MAG: type III-A CRISPR-associated RAMP protein Csm4, partial [Candidatus Aenigmatarchaeota archaeon]
MKIVKIYPDKSKFHFGYLGLDIDDEFFHSDSLFSAITINYIRKFGDENINEFVSNFPKISSLFYGWKSKKELLFIPKFLDFEIPKNLLDRDRKLIKKIKFISFDSLKEQKLKVNKNKDIIYPENIDEDINLFFDHVEEKVSIDRITLKSAEDKLFNISYVVPNEKTFFYFFVDGDITDELKESINMIKIFGLGGRINTGSGKIKEIEFQDFPGFETESKYYTNLSVVYPKSTEVDYIIKYKLLERKGWLYNDSSRKDNLISIGEGSIFSRK